MTSENNRVGELEPDPICPSCGHKGLQIFYEVQNVPVHSCLMLKTRDEARTFPCGDIKLGFCESCGFITNVAFDPKTEAYAANYEDQQTFSPTFQTYAEALARRLIDSHNLRDKDIIEIGCSKGDFLILLCELGHNRGIGIDPAAVEGRVQSEAADRISFICDYYSEKYAHLHADLICCRHTLEHIHPTSEFMTVLRRGIGDRVDTKIFFDLPDAKRVLTECAFWDIYYEHCSYFTAGSLARLFRSTGFDVTYLDRDFADQWLVIEAVPASGKPTASYQIEETSETIARHIREFTDNVRDEKQRWRERLSLWRETGRRAAVWGSGSKCVSFLTTMDAADLVDCVVDINPHRHGLFIPGAAKEVVAPDVLKTFQPDDIVVMNPIYENEIREMLAGMELYPNLLSLGMA